MNKEYSRQYYLKNKEKIKSYSAEWHKKKPLYAVFTNIQQRCNNPNHPGYPNYGGRGIKCLLTLDDLKFLWKRDAIKLNRPSIDRIDNNGNYTLENCRFIERSLNTRRKMLWGRKNIPKMYLENPEKLAEKEEKLLLENYPPNPLRKVVEFYTPEQKEIYRKFLGFISGRSVQGVIRTLISYMVSRPELMNEVISEYDKAATSNRMARFNAL